MGRVASFRALGLILTILTVMYVVIPLVGVLLLSVNPRVAPFPEGFTLKWYQLHWDMLLESIGASFSISVPAVLIALVISLPLGIALARYEFRGKSLVAELTVLPIAIPGVALGLAFLQMFSSPWFAGLPPMTGLIMAHVVIALPYTARPIIEGFKMLDPALEEASATLGSVPFATFRRVTLPLLRPFVLSGSLLGFARSINDFIVTLFLVQPDIVPLAVQVYRTTQYGIPQFTSAIGSVLLVLSVAFAMLVEYALRVEVKV